MENKLTEQQEEAVSLAAREAAMILLPIIKMIDVKKISSVITDHSNNEFANYKITIEKLDKEI